MNVLGGPFLTQCSQFLWLCKAVGGHFTASGNSRLSLSRTGERFAWSEEDQRGLAPFWEREPHAHSLSCSENSDMITYYLLCVTSFWRESCPTQDSERETSVITRTDIIYMRGIVLNHPTLHMRGSQVTKEKLRHREVKCRVSGHTAGMIAHISLTLKPMPLISNVREKEMFAHGEGRME